MHRPLGAIRRSSPRGAQRGGTVLVVVLVALGLALGVCGAMFRAAANEQRMLRRQLWQAQADWLAEAGLRRAARRLSTDGAWTGETWMIEAEELGGPSAGRVVIDVGPSQEGAALREVRVRADFPAEADLPAVARVSAPVAAAAKGD
jgi:hypothetical protein